MTIRTGRRHVASLCALALGCASARETTTFRLNPFAATEVRVISVEKVGPYLFAAVHGTQLDLRFAVAATPLCARVLERGESIRYQKSGNFGRFERGDESCDAVGTLSLAGWRDGQPRHRSGASVVPRTSARYEVAGRDAGYLLLRGRFALASRIGVPGAFDVVAVLPDDERCRPLAERRDASLEFRPAGPEPFRILSGNAPCVVEGFAMPVEGLPGPSAPAQ